ncbi:methyltransferase [Lysinibacillus macroides]|uniref:Methyltransferase n=1 Tax=Lysinibacillus macroides TaxID=33935 RepID=A0A0N0UWK3_9BACI|nr:methyltransferase [Lysinibacillus macroides]
MRAENIQQTSHILDVGCGTGQTAAYLAASYQANVTALDSHPLMVAKARQRMHKARLPVQVIQGSIEQLPLPDQSFDLIIAESVLAFVPQQRALQEIYRLLKPCGRFIAIECTIPPSLPILLAKTIQQFYGFEALLTKKEWVDKLQQAGFQAIRIQKNKTISSPPEFQLSKDIEPALYQVMEQHMRMNEKYENSLDYRIYSCTK